jgi:hypothetical protein
MNKLRKLNKSPLLPTGSGAISPGCFELGEELDEDMRTFEEKYYLIESTQLGEGCSSIVKECVLRSC